MCDDYRLDYTIHYFLQPNTEKAVDLLIHEVVLIYNILRNQAGRNPVLLMLRHQVVEVEVIDINHYVFGSWG